MDPLWPNLFAFLFMLTWVGGVVVLGVRANAKGKDYLRRLPPVKGVPLDMYMFGENEWFRGWRGPVWRAYRQRQADPDLERLRQEARRRGRYLGLWIVGFPAVVFGVLALLIVTSYVR